MVPTDSLHADSPWAPHPLSLGVPCPTTSGPRSILGPGALRGGVIPVQQFPPKSASTNTTLVPLSAGTGSQVGGSDLSLQCPKPPSDPLKVPSVDQRWRGWHTTPLYIGGGLHSWYETEASRCTPTLFQNPLLALACSSSWWGGSGGIGMQAESWGVPILEFWITSVWDWPLIKLTHWSTTKALSMQSCLWYGLCLEHSRKQMRWGGRHLPQDPGWVHGVDGMCTRAMSRIEVPEGSTGNFCKWQKILLKLA